MFIKDMVNLNLMMNFSVLFVMGGKTGMACRACPFHTHFFAGHVKVLGPHPQL